MRWRPGSSPVAPGSDVCPAHVDTVIGRVFCDRPLLPNGEHAPYDPKDVIEGSGYHESLHRGGDGRGDNRVARMRYRLVSADPAWRFSDRLTMSKVKRGADAQYHSTMSIPEICALPVRDLADDDAVLCLWRPSSFAREALAVVDAWGFEVKTEIVWYKVRPSGKAHFGMGRLTRAACEVAYLCTRGKVGKHIARRNLRNVFVSPPLRHSAKPDHIQTDLASMIPGPALELFARRDLDGWTCVGNECPSTFGLDMRDVLRELVESRLTRSAPSV